MNKNYPHILSRLVKPYLNPANFIEGIANSPLFFRNLFLYQKQAGKRLLIKDIYPQLHDRTGTSNFDAHYFYSTAWAFRRIISSATNMHVDIGSNLSLCSLLSGVCPVCFVDYRPLFSNLENLYSVGGDLLALPFATQSVSSVSCIHVLEHIGLGRYGDSLDVQGTEKALFEIERILQSSGNLFLAVPIGKERICFDAHRIFFASTIVNLCKNFSLIEYSGISDEGEFFQRIPINCFDNSEYACGFFWFRKK